MDKGRLLADGSPAELKARAKGLTFTALPPPGMPARELQARLIDARDLVIDAMPQAGNVRFIRQPGAADADLRNLLDGIETEARRQELEDAFMMLLRAQD